MDDSELEGIIERNRRELEREELGANSDEENNELVDSARKAREDAEKTSRHPLRAYRDAIKHLRSRPPVHVREILYYSKRLYSYNTCAGLSFKRRT